MDRRKVLALIASTGTAGCLRLTGGETPTGDTKTSALRTNSSNTVKSTPADTTTPTATETPTETQTPTETSTPTQTPRPSLPTGVSESGIEHADFLFAAHIDSIRERSASIQWTKLDKTHGYIQRKKGFQVDGVEALGEWTRQEGGRVQIYYSPLSEYWREDLGDHYTYGDDHSTTQGYTPGFWGIEILPLLKSGDWGPPARVNDGTPAIWELKADSAQSDKPVPGFTAPPEKVVGISEATLSLDGLGIIRSVYALYQIERDGERETLETNYQVDSIGQTTVKEPSWISTARDRAPTATATLTDDRRFLEFRLESGNRLEQGTKFDLNDNLIEQDDTISITLEEPVEPETVSYLFTEDDSFDGSGGQISRESRPSDVDPVPLDNEYTLGVRRRDSHYMDSLHVP